MRIDSHHFLTPQHPIEHLAPILLRNRFEGSIWVVNAGDRLEPADHPLVQAIAIDWDRRSLVHEKLRAAWWDLDRGLPEGLEALAGRNLTLDLKLRSEHLPLVPRIAAMAPELRMVLCGLASPPFGEVSDGWARDLEIAARLPRLFCKTDGLVRNDRAAWNAAQLRPYVQFALKVFGPARVLFASGWPECLPASTWKETLAAFTQSIGAQTMETREGLLGENARRAYALPREALADA